MHVIRGVQGGAPPAHFRTSSIEGGFFVVQQEKAAALGFLRMLGKTSCAGARLSAHAASSLVFAASHRHSFLFSARKQTPEMKKAKTKKTMLRGVPRKAGKHARKRVLAVTMSCIECDHEPDTDMMTH